MREMYIECAFNVSRIFFRFWCAITIGAEGIGAPLELRITNKMNVFGAPCLLTCQSPNKLSPYVAETEIDWIEDDDKV